MRKTHAGSHTRALRVLDIDHERHRGIENDVEGVADCKGGSANKAKWKGAERQRTRQ